VSARRSFRISLRDDELNCVYVFGHCPEHTLSHKDREVVGESTLGCLKEEWDLDVKDPLMRFRDTPYSIWKAGKGDRFTVAAKGLAHQVIGYVYSNGDGTWSIERKGQKLPDTYNSIDQAATALMALASKRPVVAKAQHQNRVRKK
jgi:hypothetical protein